MKLAKIKVNDQWELMVPAHRAQQWDVRWEPDRLDSMFKNIRAGDIIMDVGSENGDMTALYAMWAGSLGGVIMVEAVSNYWPWAWKTFEANGLHPPLKSFVGFASDHKSEGDSNDKGNFGAKVYTGWPPAATTEIWIEEPGFQSIVENTALPHLTINEIMAEWKLDILTFDVEGSELEVLKGAEHIINTSKPLIYASIHPEFIERDYGHKAEEVYQYLESLGYKYKVLAHVHEDHVLFWHPQGRLPV